MTTFATALLFVLTAGPVAADAKSDKPKSDPNKMICRSEPVLGSRLQSQRICMTRRGWAERSFGERMTMDRAQRFWSKGG